MTVALPAVAAAVAAGVQAVLGSEVELLSLFVLSGSPQLTQSTFITWVAALGLLERLAGSAALVAMAAAAATAMMTLEKAARAAWR